MKVINLSITQPRAGKPVMLIEQHRQSQITIMRHMVTCQNAIQKSTRMPTNQLVDKILRNGALLLVYNDNINTDDGHKANQ
jgi:hypothetical protein